LAEKFAEIDVSAVEKLGALKKQRVRLEKFIERAEEKAESISEGVYQTVIKDYQDQLERLTADAQSYNNDARQAYALFKPIHEDLKQAFEQARADKEEIEFRNAIGEVSKEELGERLQACECALDRCRSDLVESGELNKRFMNAFDTEDELELDIAPIPQKVVDGTGIVPAGPESDARQNAGVPADKTMLMAPESIPPTPVDETMLIAESAVPAEQAPPAATLDSTFIVPVASLVREAEEDEPVELALGCLNYIGRAVENQIQISRPGVSRVHAVITANATGFTLKDLESQNGTYVNDERITERLLEDGDRIRIASTAELVFRRA